MVRRTTRCRVPSRIGPRFRVDMLRPTRSRVVALNMASEPVERTLPERAAFAEPSFDFVERLGVQRTSVHAPIDFSRDESRSLQNTKVLGYGGE